MANITDAILDKYLSGSGATKKSAQGYTYIDGNALPNVLSNAVLTASLAKTWIVPGVACTEEFVAGYDTQKVNSVYVEMQADIGPTTRTIGEGGTTGNSGIINQQASIMVSTEMFEIPLRQVDDQPLFFPRMQIETMRYDKTKKALANFVDNMVVSKATYETATAIQYALFRASKEYTASSNSSGALPSAQFIEVDSTKFYDDNYIIKVLDQMDELMDNGDELMQTMTFSGPRALIGRLSFLDKLKSPKSGFVQTAANAAYELLISENFDSSSTNDIFGATTETKYLEIRGYDCYKVPAQAWKYIETWLGLSEGALKHVLGIITSPQQLATGGVTEDNTIVKDTTYPAVGVGAYPYRKYGARGYRNIILIVDSGFKAQASNGDFAKYMGTKGSGTPVEALTTLTAPVNFKTRTIIKNELSNGPHIQIAAVGDKKATAGKVTGLELPEKAG